MEENDVRVEEFGRLISDYRDSVLRLAFAYLKNRYDAEDVTQDVFVAYIRKSPVFRNRKAEKAWFMQVAANKCKNILTSSWRKRTVELTEELSYLPSNEFEILECVLSLDEKYRIPLHLFYYEDYTIEEIAKITEMNPSTVGTRLARGRKILKKVWKEDCYEQI